MATLSTLKNSYANKTGVASLLTENQRQIAINTAIAEKEEAAKNNGGFFGGIGYLGHKIGLGFLSGIEILPQAVLLISLELTIGLSDSLQTIG